MPIPAVFGNRTFLRFGNASANSFLNCSTSSAFLKLDAGVDVFRVLAKNHHAHEVRALHRRFHAAEVPHRPEAHIQIVSLPQRNVERPDATANWRRERPFDTHEVRPNASSVASGSQFPVF